MSTGAEKVRRLREQVATMQAVIDDVWRWSTKHADKADAIDIADLRAKLAQADADYELRTQLDLLLEQGLTKRGNV